jgi:hypothetical protein
MALQKQTINIDFSSGVDTKTDVNQLEVGKFQSLVNSVFDTLKRLTKRNGFGPIASLPDSTSTFLTTFNGNLTAIGTSLQAYSQGTATWINKGGIQPLQLSTLPLIRSSSNQSQADVAIASNGLICTVYTDNVTNGSSTIAIAKYAVADSITGQNIISPTIIPSSIGSVSFSPRVFSLYNNFVLVFSAFNGATYHLQYLAINQTLPTSIGSATDVTTNYQPTTGGGFDGVVANNTLFLSWNGGAGSGVRTTSFNQQLAKNGEFIIGSVSALTVSVTADNTTSTPTIWTSWYGIGSTGYAVATNSNLSTLFSARTVISSASALVSNITAAATNGVANIYYETVNAYPYDSSIQSNYINSLAVNTSGSVSSAKTLVRSVGLASKAFFINSTSYFLSSYSSPYQPSYFLINGSSGAVVAKLAYSNGGGYVTTGLGSVVTSGSSTAQFSYLIKDVIQAVNKGTSLPTGTQVNGIYSQTGINLASVTFGTGGIVTSEIANNLHLNGGFLSMYDGYSPVEHNFHVWPDSIEATAGSSSGNMTNQTYYYQATYEWADNQGNVFRSAPSIPVVVGTVSPQGTVTVTGPMLRLTAKTANPPKVVLYRWSTNQPIYYQTTSISQPIVNNPLVDSWSYKDSNSDASILGNNIIYTNGGVVEDIAGPACTGMTIFDSRLNLIDAEDQNLLWYGKQVIEATPVEMSDLFTNYIAPTQSAQGSTGPMQTLYPMDDKQIIFKKNAIYYINGTGPDNTGANSQYSQPIFVTATVGCSNLNSIVLIPQGIMFQSDDKGIWLLGRDLSTTYVGHPIETFNRTSVVSANIVPSTNQVRFMLSNGTTLLYDYLVQEWGEFDGIPGISATIYNNLYTFINAQGNAFQETPGQYLDGSSPTLMSFKTGWISPGGIQGYVRAYSMTLLGSFISPHRLTIGIAYDYDPAIVQLASIVPDNYTGTWGSGSSWGSISTWGGSTKREQWKINFDRQQCQSFQLTFNEYYDSSVGPSAGGGLTVSGIKLAIGVKKAYAKNIPSTHKTS